MSLLQNELENNAAQVNDFSYSVLMSVYCKETPEYLRESISSMLNQTTPPAEIVIVEDGPLTDELYAVLNEFGENCGERFVRVVNETNLGLGLALNKGLLACSNEIVARMDTDDISAIDRCERQLEFLRDNPEVDIVGANIAEFIETPSKPISKREVPQTHDEICEFMKKRCPLNHVTVMFKKSAVLKAGNYLEWHYNEDYYLWVRMYLAGAKFANLNEDLVNVRVGKEMFARRGGKAYYKSEKALFRFMYKNKMISWLSYQKSKFIRFVVQRVMTNGMRQRFFAKHVRSRVDKV